MKHRSIHTMGCVCWLVGTGMAFAQGSVNYAWHGGSGDYIKHALSASVAGWAGARFELGTHVGPSKDAALDADDFSAAVGWNTPLQWVPDTPVRLGLRWGYADYSLRNSALVGTDRMPVQYRWALTAALPVTNATSLSLQSQWNGYSVYPGTMAAPWHQRPHIQAALGLADFTAFEHRATLQWLAGNRWRWSAGGSYGQTVLGQSLRSVDASLEIPWNAATSVGLSLQHAQIDELLRTNGLAALPYQSGNSLSLSWNWSWD